MSRLTIRIPNGKSIPLGVYVSSWKALKSLAPDTEIAGWSWHPVTAADILRELRRGIHDRINRRGGVVLRAPKVSRIHRHLRARVQHSCRWCGSPLQRYEPEYSRFCDAACARSFRA